MGRPRDVTTWREIGALESDKIYVNLKITYTNLPNVSTSTLEKTLGVDTILNNVDQVGVKLGSLAGVAQTIGSAASARQQALALAVQANTASDTVKITQARGAASSFESQFGTAVLTYQKIAGVLSATANILSDNDARLNGILPPDSSASGSTTIYSFYSLTDASKVSSLQAAQAAAQSGYNAVAAMPSALLSVFASMGSWATAQFVGAGGTAVAAAGGELLIAGFGGNHILIGGAGRDTFAFVGGNGAALDTINNFQAGANGDRLLLAGAGNIGYFGENGAGWAQLRYASGSGYASVQFNGVSYQGLSLYDNLQGIDTADFRDMGHGVNIALNSVTPRDFDGYTHVRNVSGSAYGDTLAGDAQDNILTGGAGDDTLMGGSGNDTYIWCQGDGNDTIREQDQSMSTTSMDVLKLLDVNADQVSYSRSGNDLLVKILPTNEVITIRNQYGTLDQRVEVVEYANGSRRLLPVANTLPAGNVQIKSAAGVLTATSIVTQNDVLTATHNLIDPDGIGTMRYQWYANGELIAGAVAATFAPTQAEVGKQISVRLEYTDGFGTVEAVSSSPTAVVANKNDAPVGTVTINGVVTEGQTLTASHNLSDADGLGTVQYQWYADGVLIEGATAASLSLTELHGNKKISVKASYIDGFGTAESVSSAVTAAVAHRNRPVSGTVNILLDAAAISADSVLKQGDILSVGSALSDPDGLGTLTYQWYADDQIIDGANGLQFVLGQAQVGKHISVKVSYVDGYGSAEAVTSQSSGSVLNVNDAPAGKIVISGFAIVGKTLIATSSPAISDADGMGVLSYQWFADGRLIAGKTEDKLLLSDELIGKIINVEVSYIDGFGTAEKLVSVPTAIVEKAGMGTAGPDIFYGTPDADRMEGLGGDDIYYVNHPGDIVIEQLNGGNDTVYTSIDYVLADNVEIMRLTKNGLTVSGNALNNSFYIENSGGNVIDGGGGINIAQYGSSKSGVTATMQRPSSPADSNFRGDKLINIRNINGSQFDDVLNGDDGANLIAGGEGDDILRGWGGTMFLE